VRLGLEIRDRNVTAVAVDDQGRVLARREVDLGADRGLSALGALDAVAGGSDEPKIVGVATATPDSGALVDDVLRALARRYTGAFLQEGPIPSGSAAAVAEVWTGAARGAQDVVYFSAADRTTAGIVRGGTAWLGARRRAASVAWLALNPVEREDYRKNGCLEAEVATAGIVRRLIWRIKAGDRSRVEEMAGGDLGAITMDHVLDGARHGDGVSISVVRDTAKYLGMAAANLVALVDPEVLVLGGIMASAADLFLDPVRTELSRRVPKAMIDTLGLASATLGADAAAIGAARMSAVALP
jgi:predicted NBD/HSP70 family sugar kinase